MMEQSLSQRIILYRKKLASGELQRTYQDLVKILQNTRTILKKDESHPYSLGSVQHGYLDYSYFYLQSPLLQERHLKFALVLNHSLVQFELWLLGCTKQVQKKYWIQLKDTSWVQTSELPKYYIFATKLVESDNYEQIEILTKNLVTHFKKQASSIARIL
ncbi:DUF7000 family protein [Marinomonas epiphytica]